MIARDIDWHGIIGKLQAATSPQPVGKRRREWMAAYSHSHAYPEVVVCLSGKHSYGVAGGSVELLPGTLCVLPPRCLHDSTYGPHHRKCIDLWMHFLPRRGAVTLNLVEHDPRTQTKPWPLPMPGVELMRDAMRTVELIGNGGQGLGLSAEARFFVLYFSAMICRHLQQAGIERTDSDQMTVIRHVKEYVTENLGDDLNLEHLAKVAGYSPFHFHRLFQRMEGVTIRRFVECERLRLAQGLMLDGFSITAAASEAGFESSSHFARVFKRRMGLTASRWLKKQELHSQSKK